MSTTFCLSRYYRIELATLWAAKSVLHLILVTALRNNHYLGLTLTQDSLQVIYDLLQQLSVGYKHPRRDSVKFDDSTVSVNPS